MEMDDQKPGEDISEYHSRIEEEAIEEIEADYDGDIELRDFEEIERDELEGEKRHADLVIPMPSGSKG